MPSSDKDTNINKEEKQTNDNKRTTNSFINKNIQKINKLLGQSAIQLYGTDRQSEVDDLDKKFSDILHNQLSSMTNNEDGDITSFINKVYSNDKKLNYNNQIITNQFLNSMGNDFSQVQSLFYEAYKNKLLEQNDLHEIASSLIELGEAINIMRDAIISADIVEGRMSRSLSFDNDTLDEDRKSTVELMEKKFQLLKKIKDFIIPRTLEYGEYYVYIMPYAKLFADFAELKSRNINQIYRESTLYESVVNVAGRNKSYSGKGEFNEFCESCYNDYKQENSKMSELSNFPSLKDFSKDMKEIMGNISICNDPVPLPVLYEGFQSMDKYVTESIDGTLHTEDAIHTQDDLFSKFNSSEGIHSSKKNESNEFKDVKDCYIRMMKPTTIVPVKILDSVFGYYYVEEEDITPLANSVANSLYMTNYDAEPAYRGKSIIDNITERIVKGFDKKFLLDNTKFKKEIANAINYYNLSKKKIKFQFIPKEYIVDFKIDEDEDGNGTSMLKKSLFYAKLYLMLLLFKIMSIILYSNDQKVNYLKTSGIDKDIINKAQEIARAKQNRQINIMDLFSYTTLINKVGNGNELWLPVGRSGDRPWETEILQGQEVQLNSELLDMLKNAYITATGVPFEILNQLNQVEFAKQVEQSNSRLNGRVVNYQLDFNESITRMYKKIMKYSTNLEDVDIDGFKFILQPPKTTAGNAKNEAIQTATGVIEYALSLFYDDPNNSTDPNINLKIREFKKAMTADLLPQLNLAHIEEIYNQANMTAKEKALKPDPMNGDDDMSDVEADMDNLKM